MAIQRCHCICETISSGREVLTKILKFNTVRERAGVQGQSISLPWEDMTWREGWEVVFQRKLSVRGMRRTLDSWRQNSASWWLARSQNSTISKGVQRGSHCAVTSAAWPTEALLPHSLSFCFSAKSYPLSFKDSQSSRSLQSWCQKKGPAYLSWNNTALVGSWWGSGLETWRETESETSGSTHRWVSGAAQFHWNSGPISRARAMCIFVERGNLCLLSNFPGNQW